jgi:cysteine desulfurase / selenocysteine lyase
MTDYYETTYANVNRGVYRLAAEATDAYEGARAAVARFIGAPRPTRSSSPRTPPRRSTSCPAPGVGPTSGRRRRRAHPDGAPRQHRAVAHARRRAGHRAALDPAHRRRPARPHRPRPPARRREGCSAFTAMSNVLGTITPVRRDRRRRPRRRRAGAIVDACQYVPHLPTDVQAMGADFVAFTGHKMLGPTGIGVLWGREELLDAMPPFLGGGEMILDVRLDGFTTELPCQVRGRHAAHRRGDRPRRRVDYLESPRHGPVRRHEVSSPATPCARSRALRRRHHDPRPVRAGRAAACCPSPSATCTPTTSAQVLDQHGVCVRAGHHCAKPLMRCSASAPPPGPRFYVYNDESDVDALAMRSTAPRLLRLLTLLRPLGEPTMPGLEDLYREIILDHYRNPRNRASSRCRRPTGPRGSTRCAATRSWSTSTSTATASSRHQGRRPGLLDQPVVGVDDVGRR